MVDSSCSPLTLVRRTLSGNLILCADPIRKKLSSVLGRQTHFPFWNTSSPTVTTLCYKEYHRFVFSVSSDEGRGHTAKKWLQPRLMFLLLLFLRFQNIIHLRKSQVISWGGESAHPVHPFLDLPLFMKFCYAAVDMPSWWMFIPWTVIQTPESVDL